MNLSVNLRRLPQQQEAFLCTGRGLKKATGCTIHRRVSHGHSLHVDWTGPRRPWGRRQNYLHSFWVSLCLHHGFSISQSYNIGKFTLWDLIASSVKWGQMVVTSCTCHWDRECDGVVWSQNMATLSPCEPSGSYFSLANVPDRDWQRIHF